MTDPRSVGVTLIVEAGPEAPASWARDLRSAVARLRRRFAGTGHVDLVSKSCSRCPKGRRGEPCRHVAGLK